MNRKILSSLVAALVMATLGFPIVSQANPSSTQTAELDAEADAPSSSMNPTIAAPNQVAASEVQTTSGAVKVGERQSNPTAEPTEAAIAQIQAHEMNGRQAATLYVRNIPVLTFVGDTLPTDTQPVKLGKEDDLSGAPDTAVKSIRNSTTTITSSANSLLPGEAAGQAAGRDIEPSAADPVWRATQLAATLNQHYREGLDAAAVTVKWQTGDRYAILLGQEELVEIDDQTRLPDSTRNRAEDALQATNRLRRLLGNAGPVAEIIDMPQPEPQRVAQAPTAFRVSGLASWYGPGFNGRRSASGEIFNQNALTAAHRTLPFGTRVRVTNLQTGQEVVVRINDRGPFHGNRVLDLSAGAAQAIGLLQLGVAPVQIDVLGATPDSAN